MPTDPVPAPVPGTGADAVLHRFQTLLGEVADLGAAGADRWCQALAGALPVDAAAISLAVGADLAVPVGASDAEAATAEVVQFTTREGPFQASVDNKEMTIAEDVLELRSVIWTRWPVYAAALCQHTPFRAVLACPLAYGTGLQGSLTLYRRAPGPFERLAETEMLASYVSAQLLPLLSDDADDEAWLSSPAGLRREQVWIVQGMILQANAVRPEQALELLRAQAFATDRLIDDLAADVLAGRAPVPRLSQDQ